MKLLEVSALERTLIEPFFVSDQTRIIISEVGIGAGHAYYAMALQAHLQELGHELGKSLAVFHLREHGDFFERQRVQLANWIYLEAGKGQTREDCYAFLRKHTKGSILNGSAKLLDHNEGILLAAHSMVSLDNENNYVFLGDHRAEPGAVGKKKKVFVPTGQIADDLIGMGHHKDNVHVAGITYPGMHEEETVAGRVSLLDSLANGGSNGPIDFYVPLSGQSPRLHDKILTESLPGMAHLVRQEVINLMIYTCTNGDLARKYRTILEKEKIPVVLDRVPEPGERYNAAVFSGANRISANLLHIEAGRRAKVKTSMTNERVADAGKIPWIAFPPVNPNSQSNYEMLTTDKSRLMIIPAEEVMELGLDGVIRQEILKNKGVRLLDLLANAAVLPTDAGAYVAQVINDRIKR